VELRDKLKGLAQKPMTTALYGLGLSKASTGIETRWGGNVIGGAGARWGAYKGVKTFGQCVDTEMGRDAPILSLLAFAKGLGKFWFKHKKSRPPISGGLSSL
jgi:hypothetical protein